MIDRNMLEYRREHKRCKFCRYSHITTTYHKLTGEIYSRICNCVLKQKNVNPDLPRLCEYYDVDKEKD